MKVLEKVDLYKLHKDAYAATRKPRLVDVAAAAYLAIGGQGVPGSETFTQAIGALYGVAFTAKMTRKFGGQQDYAVCKLEAQWWTSGGKEAFDLSAPAGAVDKSAWRWKLLIRTPEFVTPAEVEQAISVLLRRGKGTAAEHVHLETLSEGTCVQALHVGPYEDESETIAMMRAFADGKGLRFEGRHHEIYLSDPRRVAPARLRTILRQPLARV